MSARSWSIVRTSGASPGAAASAAAPALTRASLTAWPIWVSRSSIPTAITVGTVAITSDIPSEPCSIRTHRLAAASRCRCVNDHSCSFSAKARNGSRTRVAMSRSHTAIAAASNSARTSAGTPAPAFTTTST